MKTSKLPQIVAAAVVILAGYAILHHQSGAEPRAAEATASRHVLSATALHYDVGSPQLAALHIDTVHREAPPVVDPLPGRIALDEDHTVRVYSPVAGKVLRIAVEPGQVVHAGDVLAELYAPDVDAALADLRKAQTDHDVKAAQLQRSRQLHDAGVIATRELEQAQGDERAAQAELTRASARVRELAMKPSDQGGRFAVRAPLNGVVAERHLNPGQELRPDADTPAFVITDLRHLDAVAEVSETDVQHLRVGQLVKVESDALTAPMPGHISHIGVLMDADVRRIPVRVHLDAPPAQARPEMFVRLTALDTEVPAAVVVPNGAIVTTGAQSHVFVETRPGELTKTPVTLVARGRTVSHVGQGLADTARIVTQGAILLDAELSEAH